MGFTRRKVFTYILLALLPLILGAAIAIIAIWHDQEFYVRSEDARVLGTMYQISAPVSGQVIQLRYDVGDPITSGQTVAIIDTGSNGGLPTLVPSLPHMSENVLSPRTGTVAKRYVHEGERVASGADILELVDLNSLYVIADVDETKVSMLQAGEQADVYLNALDINIPGEVSGVTPATEDLVTTVPSGAPGSVSSGQSPLVPVLIAIEYGTNALYPGMSANVTIHVR